VYANDLNNMNYVTLSSVQSFLSPRAIDANKGDFGRVLVIGSDFGMPGAVRICAEGALRVGAGLVTVATRPEHIASVVGTRPELLCYGLMIHESILADLIRTASVIVLGPGLGSSMWSEWLFNEVLSCKVPLLIDADGLNWLSKKMPITLPKDCIVTPHPGEAARLLGIAVDVVQRDRVHAAHLLQQKFGGVVVLKGAGTLLVTAAQPLLQCAAGNPGMASAGMGDLLSGIIAGLVAQGLDSWKAAQMGVLVHAEAADRIARKQGVRGMLASDLLAEIPVLINGFQ